jgi:hypothetical protein
MQGCYPCAAISCFDLEFTSGDMLTPLKERKLDIFNDAEIKKSTDTQWCVLVDFLLVVLTDTWNHTARRLGCCWLSCILTY